MVAVKGAAVPPYHLTMNDFLQACASIDLTAQLNAGGAPEWIHVMQAGTFKLHDGRGPYTLKDPAAVIEASKREKVDLLIDRDHQTQLAPKGTPVLAAGWVKELQSRPDGIWARVEWTDAARAQIAAKEYRYISPVFNYSKTTGEITRITHASLVNDPAMELTAVAAADRSSQPQKENIMDKSLLAIAALLGLKDGVSAEAVVTAAAERLNKVKDIETALASARKTLGLKDDADGTAIASAIAGLSEKGGTVDPAQYVPMKAHQELASQLSALQKTVGDQAAETAVASAMKAGKISPAMKDWALSYAGSNPDGFAKYVETAPVIVAASETAAAGKAAEEQKKLTDEERAICSQLGLSEEQFLKTAAKDKDAA